MYWAGAPKWRVVAVVVVVAGKFNGTHSRQDAARTSRISVGWPGNMIIGIFSSPPDYLLIAYFLIYLLIYLRYDVAVTHTHLCMENHFNTISKILLFSYSIWTLWILWFQLPDRDICTFFVSSLLLFHWDLVCCTSPEIFHSRLLFLFFLATDVFPVELVQFPRNKNTSSI